MFTDDAGTEFAIGGSTVSGVDSVTAGNGLTQNATTGDVTLNVGVGTGLSVAADSIGLNYSALAEKTGDLVGTDRIAACSSTGTEFVETISNIPLSIFNNDAGFITNGVAVSGSPSDGQIAVWTGGSAIEGDVNLQYDTVTNQLMVLGDGAVRIDERATGPSGITAHGLLWVRNDAPNTLMFTDDLGNEIEVAGTASGVTSVTAGNGLTQNQTTGAVTLNVGVGTGLSVAADSIGLNYSALPEKTGTVVGTDRIAIASGASEVCETISNIPLSIFNNDLPSGGNADTLDGLDSTAFARLGTTTPPDNYLYTGRAHTSSAMYVRQGSSGDIARFLQSATAGATSSTTQVTITNSGGITATGNITGSSSLEWNQLWVQQIELNSTDTTIARKAAGVVSVENRAMIAHASSTYTSAEVTFSVSTPTTQGTDGDIWFVY